MAWRDSQPVELEALERGLTSFPCEGPVAPYQEAVDPRVSPMVGWASLALLQRLWPAGIIAELGVITLVIWRVRVGGRQPSAAHQFPETGLALIGLVAVKFLYQFFFFNATGEEAGWRGFALPRMQALTNPLVACLVLNIFWPLWHLFLWMAEGRPISSPEYWGRTYLELLPATVTLAWFYNRSKGSILVAGIAHAAANTAFAFFPNLDWTVFTWTTAGAALVLILVDRMWKKLPSGHPAVASVDYYNEKEGETWTRE